MKKVFIASRFEEFKEVREILKNELIICNMNVIDLNDNQAVAQSPLNRSLQNVRESDAVILLVGDSYGIPPAGESKSYTHLEYEEAIQHGIPVYCFAIGTSYINNKIEYSSDPKLKEWQKTLENATISMFDEDEDIKMIVHKIVTSVYKEENKIWFDEESGLMWQVIIDASEEHGRLQWNEIFKYCENKNKECFGGFSDWRIPTIEELETLVIDQSHPNKYGFDEESFIKKPLLYSMRMKYGRFWSSTSNPNDHEMAYGINFNRKRNNSQSKRGNKEKYKTRYVRCVRLWRNEDIQIEWEKIQDSYDQDVLIGFLKTYPNNRYEEKIKNLLEDIKQKEQKHFDSLNPIEQKIFKLTIDKSIPKSTLLYNAIKQGYLDEIKYNALIELKRLKEEDGSWKEISNSKKPEKDKDYQRTLDIIELLEQYKENIFSLEENQPE